MTHHDASASGGFTFTEVLIVVAVLALISAIFVPVYLSQRDRARDATVKQSVETIAMALKMYSLDHHDRFPLALSDPHGKYPLRDDEGSPYIDAWPDNPWTGQPMVNNGTFSKGNFKYAGYASVASLQPGPSTADRCMLLGWVTNNAKPYVATLPGPRAAPVEIP
jgi:prepilin-type N-terminal cleavage/methylation domain-containing protein